MIRWVRPNLLRRIVNSRRTFTKKGFETIANQHAKQQNEQHQIYADQEEMEHSIQQSMPRHPDDDPDLRPDEQDSSFGRTTTTMLSLSENYRGMITIDNVDENLIIVKAQGGALYRVKGALMCMKNIVLTWRAPENIDDWRIEHFAPVFLIHPKTFLVIIGTGDMFVRLPVELMEEFKRRGIAIEISNTYHASALYNLLCTERDGNGIMLFTKELKTPRYVFDVKDSMPKGPTAGEVMQRRRAELEASHHRNMPRFQKGKQA